MLRLVRWIAILSFIWMVTFVWFWPEELATNIWFRIAISAAFFLAAMSELEWLYPEPPSAAE